MNHWASWGPGSRVERLSEVVLSCGSNQCQTRTSSPDVPDFYSITGYTCAPQLLKDAVETADDNRQTLSLSKLLMARFTRTGQTELPSGASTWDLART